MMEYGVSVIIPAYNAECFLEETLRSVLSQGWKLFEVILIDDASTDKTPEIARRYMGRDSRIRYYRMEHNSGVSMARQKGISLARYDWIAFLDSDDLWDRKKLELQMNYLMEHPQVDLCYTASTYFMENCQKETVVPVPEETTLRELLKKNIIPCSSALLRKSCVEQYKLCHDDTHEDYLLWLRLLKAGYKAAGINQPLLYYRFSAASKSGNKKKSAQMTWKTYRYFGLGITQSLYYMLFYTVISLRKYISIFHIKGTNR